MDLLIDLKSASAQPLHKQIYQELRRSILSGTLTAGQRIPSTRALAKSLGLSRATVSQGYEQLVSEGYLQTAIGSGTVVSAQLPDDLVQTPRANPTRVVKKSSTAPLRLSRFGSTLSVSTRDRDEPEPLFSFKYGRPALDEFPLHTWRRILFRHSRSSRDEFLDYSNDGSGNLALRAAIANYLTTARAVHCTADQILIVNGSQQALQLIAQVLVDADDVVAVEEPGYVGARHAFLTHGALLHPTEVDDAGIRLDKLPRKPTRLVYVTPSHQFPTGAVLSLTRRLELLAWAEKNGAFVVEDDYDSEFRYVGRPIPALQGLAQRENVIYVGTFSKVLFPALRIGYLVAPQSLVNVLERAKWLMDRHTPSLEQRVLTDFIVEGHFERHLRRMRALYDRRRQKLVNALRTHFGERVRILGENSGMHLMISLRTRWKSEEVVRRAAAASVGLTDASVYYLEKKPSDSYVLGYAALSERKIQEGIRRLADVLR